MLTRYHEDPKHIHVGCLDVRNYYIPHAPNEAWSWKNWAKSSRLELLHGEWDFNYYESFEDVPEALLEGKGLVPLEDTIEVPSVWQNAGYDSHVYVNVQYPIPFDPPYVPAQNPCGLYQKSFRLDAEQLKQQVTLNFHGVDSAFYLFVNGAFVAYSEVSHASTHIEINDYVQEGENVIKILVLKWSKATYLEDQDKLRMSGIFRDVFLLFRPKQHIERFQFEQDWNDDLTQVQFGVQIETALEDDVEIIVELLDPTGELMFRDTWEEGKKWLVESPLLWNAEEPNLYTVILYTEEEAITRPLGFRKIEIRNSVYYWNNVAIKMKGVNRHDSDPYTGATISPGQLQVDLRLMKDHNINAIRTSHYPNAPWAYDYYNGWGFYVIAEADMESHGTCFLVDKDAHKHENIGAIDHEKPVYFEHKRFGIMMHNEDYLEAVIDRTKQSVIREINNPCVAVWSIGNESGYGPNAEAALAWIKTFDTSIPTLYENSIQQAVGYQNDYSNIDIYSRMYPTVDFVEGYATKGWLDQPMCLVEFSHCMGNGPGDFEDYWKLFYNSDKLMGGFAWEWCDHAIAVEEAGETRFLYGGDFGERNHDGNFCVDGLITPDRKVKPGLLEYMNVLRPLRVSAWNVDVGQVQITLKSYLDFLDFETDYMLTIKEMHNDQCVKIHDMSDFTLAARQEKEITLPIRLAEENEFHYLLIEMTRRADARVMGTEQVIVQDSNHAISVNINENHEYSPLELVSETRKAYHIENADIKISFSKLRGQIEELIVNGQKVFETVPSWNVFRAPTDNDMYIRKEWEGCRYDQMTAKVYSTAINEIEDGGYRIDVKESLGAPMLQPFAQLDSVWTFYKNGKITAETQVRVEEDFPYLPRFGWRTTLHKDVEQVQYFAYGPQESYVDKKHSSYRGVFQAHVDDLWTDYIMPQENGSHADCRELLISGLNHQLYVQMQEDSSFQMMKFSQEQITKAKHNFELIDEERIHLHLDYRQSGIGSNSCGPGLLEEYRLDEKEIHFAFAFQLLEGEE